MESAAAAWSRGLYRPIRAFCHWASPLHLLLAPFSSMTDIFIHSKTCISPFKVTIAYSEALPTPVRTKGRFSNDLEIHQYMPYNLRKRRSFRGRSFQTLGLATENARFCKAAVRAKGTTRTPFSAERRDRLPDTG